MIAVCVCVWISGPLFCEDQRRNGCWAVGFRGVIGGGIFPVDGILVTKAVTLSRAWKDPLRVIGSQESNAIQPRARVEGSP